MQQVSRIKSTLVMLIGAPGEVSLRSRIFHAANLFTCMMLTVVLVFNLLQGAFNAAALVFCIALTHAGIYYVSRIKKWFAIARVGFVVICYAGVAVNYFINDGIDGPSLFVFFFTFQLLVSTSRPRFHIFYILATCGAVAGLLFMEYRHPEWILSDYTDELTRVTNVLVVFVIVLLSFYWVTRTLLNNYYREKEEADRNAAYAEEQHRKLLKMTEEKDKLFSIVFHDLKSPLSSVQLYLQAISNYDLAADTDRRIKGNLLQLTKDTSAMLENVLAWIAQQSESKEPDLQPVDCAELLDACLRIELPIAERKGVSIIHSHANDNTVMCDPIMTQLILRILINNAVKFSHREQRVTVRAHRAPDSYLVSVTDEGVGIPLATQEKLFTVGIHPERGTDSEKGSGLGLSLAKRYADKQGIKIHFLSIPGEGSTFTLVFPTANADI